MKKRTAKGYLGLIARGMAMGAADVVPGVSGGTVAFITGIYNELLHSLKSCGPEALVILIKQGFPAAWKHVNGGFLLAVFGGILLSLKTFAALITFALSSEPLLVWGGFSGLIVASIVLLVKEHPAWSWRQFGALVLGCLFVVGIALAKPAQLPGDLWILFLGGFVAICAMILPGVSGSFILLLVGLYPVFLQAINEFDVLALASFGLGCICGLLVFSRFLSWLLDRFYETTLALLTGFLVGSLYVTWPWKKVLTYVEDRHGEQIPVVQVNVLPDQFQLVSSSDPKTLSVVLCAILGAVLVLSIEVFARKLSKAQ